MLTKSELTSKFIIETVAPIFNKKGYAATSMSDITNATNLTKGAIYGNFENRIVTSITEETTLYEEVLNVSETIFNQQNIKVFPNPTSDLIAVQLGGLVTDTLKVELYDASGKLLKTTTIYPGSTIAYFDVQTLYAGVYLIKITDDFKSITKKVIIKRD